MVCAHNLAPPLRIPWFELLIEFDIEILRTNKIPRLYMVHMQSPHAEPPQTPKQSMWPQHICGSNTIYVAPTQSM